MTSLIVQLVSGVIGGNLAGRILKDSSLGVLWNSVLGLVGGGLGGRILGVLSPSLESAAHSGNFSTGSILASILGGAVGGGILLASISAINKALKK
jgi:uncharacterized membrane protein YeaQ/YmgE (transglycosylase-associated protein family)